MSLDCIPTGTEVDPLFLWWALPTTLAMLEPLDTHARILIAEESGSFRFSCIDRPRLKQATVVISSKTDLLSG